MYSLREIIRDYIVKLEGKDYDLNDIYLITSSVLEKDINEIRLNLNILVSKSKKIKIISSLDKFYFSNIPLQYITHKVNFFNECYFVNKDVLIPRADTEVLVEEAIKIIDTKKLTTLLDLCTGSGCIGISIANNSSIEKVTLSDISKKALLIAKKNVINNKCKKNIKYIRSDMLKKHLKNNLKYDIIVSNPPYIPTSDISNLDLKVKAEPNIALDGGKTGLDKYINILNNAYKVLNDNGYILLEIGFNQKDDLVKIIKEYPCYRYIDCIRDYGGNDRVIICHFLRK